MGPGLRARARGQQGARQRPAAPCGQTRVATICAASAARPAAARPAAASEEEPSAGQSKARAAGRNRNSSVESRLEMGRRVASFFERKRP